MTFRAEAPLSHICTISCSKKPSFIPRATFHFDCKEVYDCTAKSLDDSVRDVFYYKRIGGASVTVGCVSTSLGDR